MKDQHRPGTQMGTKSRAILELLHRTKPTNALDIDRLLGMPCTMALSRLQILGYVRKATHGPVNGCYEITSAGRMAIGEAAALPKPAYIPHIAATMRGIYDPAVHNVSRSGLAQS